MNETIVTFDPALLLTAAIDALVESWADQVATANEPALLLQARIYRATAKALLHKADMVEGV